MSLDWIAKSEPTSVYARQRAGQARLWRARPALAVTLAATAATAAAGQPNGVTTTDQVASARVGQSSLVLMIASE